LNSSTDGRIPVGRVAKPHGVRGEVAVQLLTDHPDRFVPGTIFPGEAGAPPLVVATARSHHGRLLVRFEGIEDRDQAESLRGALLLIPVAERRELGLDEFWPESLAGLRASSVQGEHLGTVTGVITGEAQDRLVVETGPGARVEVPFVSEIVLDVDEAAGTVVIDAPEGLF